MLSFGTQTWVVNSANEGVPAQAGAIRPMLAVRGPVQEIATGIITMRTERSSKLVPVSGRLDFS